MCVLGAGRWLAQLWQVAWTAVYVTSYSDFLIFCQTSPHTHVKLLKDPVVYCLWIFRFQSLEFRSHFYFFSKCWTLVITQKNFGETLRRWESLWQYVGTSMCLLRELSLDLHGVVLGSGSCGMRQFNFLFFIFFYWWQTLGVIHINTYSSYCVLGRG